MNAFEQDVAYAVLSACNNISDHLTSDCVNWEQRRYEIAKDALCAIISSDNHNEITLDCITAVNIADELIKQLKGGNDEK